MSQGADLLLVGAGDIVEAFNRDQRVPHRTGILSQNIGEIERTQAVSFALFRIR